MAQITVTLNVDENDVGIGFGSKTLSDAISQRLKLLNNFGMSVESWSFIDQEKEKVGSTEEQPNDVSSLSAIEVDELVVRLSYYAGALEARKEISPPDWPDLCSAIAQCISDYYGNPAEQKASSIEETADRVFRESFPLESSHQEEKGSPGLIVGAPEEFTVRLAHLAGELEANSHIVAVEWDDLTAAIQCMIDAYLNDPSESRNPFDLEDAAECYFVTQFGTDEFREAAVSQGWINMTPAELISKAKETKLAVPNIPEEAPATVKDQTPQQDIYEEDKVIFQDKSTGEFWFYDSVGKDDFLDEYKDLPSVLESCNFIGVHTSPENLTAIHPSKISVIWDEIPEGYQDQANPEVLSGLRADKQYDVCYYYTKDTDHDTLYMGVDRLLSRDDILANLAANKYMEGADIYESERLLTPEEYLNGMRRNSNECRQLMDSKQLEEVRLGVENGVPETRLLRPELSAADLLKLRTELETDLMRKLDPYAHFEATDYGPELLEPGFKSESNFAKYPDRVCYIPENWDFEIDGSGVKGQDILDLCGGDKLKAQMVFDRCDWQYPATILNEWDHEDDLALEEKRSQLTQPQHRPTFSDLLKGAKDRAAAQQQSQQNNPEQHR